MTGRQMGRGSPSLRSLGVFASAVAGGLIYASRINHTIPIGGWLFWRYLTLWGWSLYLIAACTAGGLWTLERLFAPPALPRLERFVHGAALGLIVFVMGMYAGGALGLFRASFAVLWPAALLALGGRRLWALFGEETGSRRPIHPVILGFGAVALSLLYLGVMAPEAINFDASWSHLKSAVDYARHGRFVSFDADYTRNLPELASLVHTWAMTVPGGLLDEPQLRWMLAQHLELGFFLVTLAGVASMARWLCDDERVQGTWIAFFLFPAIFVYDSNLGCAADHYAAVFAAPLFLAAMRASERFDPRDWALAGALFAGALLAKYQAVYLLGGILPIVMARWVVALARRREGAGAPSVRALLLGPVVFVGLGALLVAPHFLKNWLFHNNPVYPFAQDVFASRPTLPNAVDLWKRLGLADPRFVPSGPWLRRVLDSARLVFTFSFEPHYSFTRRLPIVGALFTLGVPLLFYLPRARRLWLGYAAGLGALFVWAFLYRVDRHLQIFMPLLVASTAALLVRTWRLGRLGRASVVLLVGLQLVSTADAPFYGGKERIAAALDLIRSGYDGVGKARLRRYADEVALGQSLPADAKVLLHSYRPSLGIDRDVLLDVAGAQGLISYESAVGGRSLWQIWRAAGVTHLVWPPGHLPAPSKHEEVLFDQFVARDRSAWRQFGAEELMALPEQPPEANGPVRVLSLGLRGYADGLYPVEAMRVYDEAPDPRYPAPATAWTSDQAARLFDQADVVLVGEGFALPPSLRALLDARFAVVTRYSGRFSVYVALVH